MTVNRICFVEPEEERIVPVHVPMMFGTALAPVDVGPNGEESTPAQPATVPTSRTATTPATTLDIFSIKRD